MDFRRSNSLSGWRWRINFYEVSVERSLPVSLEVQRHVTKSQRLENLDKFSCHLWGERARQFFRSNFETDKLFVITDPKLPEAEAPQSLFAFFYDRQALRRHFNAVGDARRETRRGG